MVKNTRHVNQWGSASYACPVCGNRMRLTSLRTHIAKRAMGESARQAALKDVPIEHLKFYFKHTVLVNVPMRKWKL